MPRIAEYDSPINGLRPNEAGPEALNRAARTQGALGNEAARDIGGSLAGLGRNIGNKIDQHEAMEEIGQGAAAFAKLQDTQIKSWNDTAANADLNDNTIGDKFRDQTLEPAIEQWSQGFHTPAGQQWALAHADAFRQHMFEKTSADMMTRAGDAAIVNVHQTQSSLSNAAQSDFSSIDHLLGMHHDAVTAIAGSAGLSADQASKFRTAAVEQGDKQIIMSGFQGLAQRNPQAALTQIQSGKYDQYLTGEENTQLTRYIQTQQRMALEQKRASDAEGRRQNVDAVNAAGAQLTASLVQPDGSLRVTPDYFKQAANLATMPDAPPGLVHSSIELGRTIAREASGAAEKGVTDPNTYSQFSNRMLLPQDDPNALTLRDVYQARADGKLDDKTFGFFKSATENLQRDPQKHDAYKQFGEFTKSIRTAITQSNPLMGKLDPLGDQRYGQFQNDMTQLFEQAYANGTWRNLLNSRDPAYLGQYLKNYQGDTKSGAKGMVDALTKTVPLAPAAVAPGGPAAPQIKAGESTSDFAKRLMSGGQ